MATPRHGKDSRLSADPEMRVLGARIRPFLENFAFDYLAPPLPSHGDAQARCRTSIAEIASQETRFWQDMLAHIADRKYLQPGLSFIAIQGWSLAPARITALDRAAAMGFFDALPPDGLPAWVPSDRQQAVLAALAGVCGVNRAARYLLAVLSADQPGEMQSALRPDIGAGAGAGRIRRGVCRRNGTRRAGRGDRGAHALIYQGHRRAARISPRTTCPTSGTVATAPWPRCAASSARPG